MTKRNATILDRIGSLIPGYTGYAKRDNQRISDKLLRDQIASRLDAVENAINDMQKNASRGEVTIDLLVLEELRKGCSTICSKIRHAAYGASALFDKELIREEELQEIYRLDEFILDQVEHLILLIQQDQEANFLVAAIRSKLKDVEKAFNERTNYIHFKGNK
jgi:hypothetical protein